MTARLDALGDGGAAARDLDRAAAGVAAEIRGLSALTSPLALDYLDRLSRPIPALTAAIGVQIVTRAYCAHLAVERAPARFGATDVPVLGTLPPLKRGRTPQDLLTRVVKATRRDFPAIRAVSAPVWEGLVVLITADAHQAAAGAAAGGPGRGAGPGPGPGGDDLVALEVVDGLARFGWVLRQADIHYGLSPEPLN